MTDNGLKFLSTNVTELIGEVGTTGVGAVKLTKVKLTLPCNVELSNEEVALITVPLSGPETEGATKLNVNCNPQ